MQRHEAILIGIVAAMIIAGMLYAGHQNNQCRSEAIKAGMKGEDVVKACR